MTKKLFLKQKLVRFLIFAGLTSSFCSSSSVASDKTIRIGSASPGSSGYIHFEACSFLVNKYAEGIKASSLATSGSSENVILLDQNKIDIASAGTLDVEAAWINDKKFGKKIPVWQVFSWTVWSLPMVTLADSDINTYKDLKGKSVSMVKKGSGAEYMFKLIFEEYGIIGDLKKNYLAWRAGIDALVDGQVKATPGNFPGGKPNPIMINLASRKPYKALEIDMNVLKQVNKRNRGILVTTLPKEAYKGFKKDVIAPGIAGVALSTADVDDELVYQFCKAVLEHADELHKISKVSEATTLQNATKWLMPEYPVHPGAVRFYKEKGVWREDLKVGNR